MGQEASLPSQEAGEPGLDPPSAQPPSSSSSPTRNNNHNNVARPGKALKHMLFPAGRQQQQDGKDVASPQQHRGEGHLYLDSRVDNHEASYYANTTANAAAPSSQTYPATMTTSASSSYHPQVGVMYGGEDPARAAAASTNTSTTTGGGGSRRHMVRPGKALLNSMRQLSIGAGSSSTTVPRQNHHYNNNNNNAPPADGLFKTTGLSPTMISPPTTTNTTVGGAVKDWETRWDEDDDEEEESSSDDEEEDEPPQLSARHASGDLLGLSTQESRPGMDVAYSSTLHPPGASAATVMMKRGIESLPQADSSILITTAAATQKLTLEQPRTRVVEDDEMEWDTGAQQQQQHEKHEVGYEKPNVEMFLPMLRVLGKGSFGKVVLVQKRRGKESGQLYAMKILRKTHLVKRRQIERTRTERKVLSLVDHPFIMKLHYAFQSDDKLYLVLDYCPGGELFFHLSRFRRFPERVARFYAAELLLAIGHLHKRGIIYRDLKPENVLLDADGHVKLGDFGLAKAGIRHPCEGALSMCGTPEYMAPEVLSQAGHGFCVDYWGLGMLTYEMMTGLPPWYTTDRAKLFRRLKSAPLDIPSYFSPESADCIGGLLERNPRRRLGVTGIRHAMEHQFFRKINWRALYARRIEAPIMPCEGWKPPETDDPCHETLEKATANFDNTFTRMPVESDGVASAEHQADDDASAMEELHADTFIGFTFDEQKEQKEDMPFSRQRTVHSVE